MAAASAFNRLGQYASSPCTVTELYCYAELAVSSLTMAVTITSIHLPIHGGMARLSWPA